LPDLSVKINLNSASDLNFAYQIKSQFPQTQNLAKNYTMQNYYSLMMGNPLLENELYHSVSAYYTNFSMYRSLMMHISIRLNSKITGMIYQTRIQDQKHFNYPVLLANPETSWTLSSGINKGVKKIRFMLNMNLVLNNYLQEINGNISKYKNIMQMYSPEIRTNYKKWPNISLNCQITTNKISGAGEAHSMLSAKPNFTFKSDFLKVFIFKADYGIELVKDKNTGQREQLDMAKASLFYQHKKSPWGFELSASNIFNVESKYSYSASEYLVKNDKTYIFPRLVLFTLSYHL